MEEILKEIEELKKRVATLEGQVQAQPREIVGPLNNDQFMTDLSIELGNIVKGTLDESIIAIDMVVKNICSHINKDINEGAITDFTLDMINALAKLISARAM